MSHAPEIVNYINPFKHILFLASEIIPIYFRRVFWTAAASCIGKLKKFTSDLKSVMKKPPKDYHRFQKNKIISLGLVQRILFFHFLLIKINDKNN